MPDDDALLWAAAVVGASFRVELVADVAGVEHLTALDVLAGGGRSRLVRVEGGAGRFTEIAGWQEVYEAVPPSERARLHGRVAEVLIDWIARGRVVDRLEVAQHLLASGPAAAEQAARFFVEAGTLASREGAPAAAAECFEQAVGALELADDVDGLRAAALCELGAARLAAGHRAGSREAFQAAVVPARRARRGDLLARAALGLGSGASGFEVGLTDRAQLDLLEEALAALPAEERAWRAAVLARLSVALSLVESVDRRRSLAEEAVTLARAAEDEVVLGAALAAQCDVLAGPEHVEARLGLATEISEVARVARHPELELLGRRHRLVALAERGDFEGVDAEIRDFAALAEVLGQPWYAWYVPLWRGMRALMEGRVADCRRWLNDAAAIGTGAGSHNAYLLTSTLRWCLLSELGDGAAVAAFAAETVGLAEEPGVWASVSLALMAAEAGQLGEARARLDSAAPRLASASRDSEWLPMLTQVAELVGHLGGHPIAAWAYEALRPHGDQFVVEGIGAAIRGSVHRPLGLLAAAVGEDQRATAHFETAAAEHRVAGAPLLVARTLHDQGTALRDPDALAAALTAYEELGIDVRVAQLRAALTTAPAPRAERRFLREGELWSLTYAGRSVRLRHSKGLADLARLLARPGQPIAALELAAAGIGTPRTPSHDVADLHHVGDLGEVLDSTARAAYRERLRELDAAIEDARDAGDDERAARSEAERDVLVEHLASAYGFGGRPRRTGSPAERARTAVTGRIRDAIRRIEATHPELGRHLRLSVRTGTVCTYEPDEPAVWTLA